MADASLKLDPSETSQATLERDQQVFESRSTQQALDTMTLQESRAGEMRGTCCAGHKSTSRTSREHIGAKKALKATAAC